MTCAFVLIFGNLLFFFFSPSLARHRACPDPAAAPTARSCRSERFPAGLPPSRLDPSLTLQHRVPGRTDLGGEGGGGAPNTRTRALTCSRAERRKPAAERPAGTASPAGSERRAPSALPCAWAVALLGGRPRLPPRGPAAGRTMLLKEYRICMPLTVDEVSAAPGPASPLRGPSPRGAAYPAAAAGSAGPLRAAGKP